MATGFISNISVIVAFFGLLTTAAAGYFAYIANKKAKSPNAILYSGYETLLKLYQAQNSEKDTKIKALEKSLDVLEADLHSARGVIDELKASLRAKDRLLAEMQNKLSEIKKVSV